MTIDPSVGEPLFAAFPAWRALARFQTAGDGSTSLIVEVPTPIEADVGHVPEQLGTEPGLLPGVGSNAGSVPGWTRGSATGQMQ